VQLRVGVIGLGESWERRHKPALVRMPDKFEVRAVYDEVAQRSRGQAAELECDAVDGFTRLIERDDIDAVYILSHAWYGVEPVRAACQARKAIYCGHAFSDAVPYADEAIEAVRSSGIRFMVEFPWRFCPATVRVMELLASGLGAPQLVFCEDRMMVSETSDSAPTRRDRDGTDIALHMADWLRFVFGRDPTSIQSIGGHAILHGPCRGFETLVTEFGEACLGNVTICRYVQPVWTEAAKFRTGPSFHVVAERGMAFLEMPDQVTWFDASGRHDELLEMDRPLGEMLADRFYRIVVHGLNPSPGLSDAQWARRMVSEARRHQAEGRKVGFVGSL
jgi:predicted dehydrogenase